MIGMHRQRRRTRHYWIALWAILALLLNQTVAASHFCPIVALAAPHASTLPKSGCPHAQMASNSIVSAVATSHTQLPSHQGTACSVHCSHAADGDQHGKSPAVPVLPTLGHDFPVVFRDTAMASCAGTDGVVLDSRQRRLYEFCTLLI